MAALRLKNLKLGKADYATWGPGLGQVYSRFKGRPKGRCCDLPSAADTLCRKSDKAVALGPLAKAD
jgi:hypothetical protein